MDKETQDILRNFSMSMYIGEKCVYCGREYKDVDMLEESEVMCAGTNPIKLACKFCFDKKFPKSELSEVDKIRKKTEQLTMDKGISKEKASKILDGEGCGEWVRDGRGIAQFRCGEDGFHKDCLLEQDAPGDKNGA